MYKRQIYGYDHTYKELLLLSGLASLKDRRTIAFEKFATNISKNQKYVHWFPYRLPTRNMRSTATYLEEKSVGNRLYNSPTFAMRRFLNRTESPEIVDMSGLFNDP